MKLSPRISIVTPNFNNADFIEETILSVLKQDYSDLEYIVVDGGSTDGSLEIIERYKDHISCIISEPDNGHANALNKGFKNATGDILAWINSDDLYPLWSFSIVSDIFSSHKDVHWIKGIHSQWDQYSRLVRVFPGRKYKNIYNFILGDYRWIQQESVFFTRSLWNKAGAYLDESYQFSIDTELWTRFFLHEKLWNVETIIGGYRRHAGNRAIKNYDSVIEESDRAVSEMLKNVDQEKINTAQKIKKAIEYKSRFSNNRIPLDWSRIINKIYRNELEIARHESIYFSHGKGWEKGRRDYEI